MKRVLAMIVCLVLLGSMAPSALADEILFRGIPWGSSITEVDAALREEQGFSDGLYMSDEYYMRRWDNIESRFDVIHNDMYASGWHGSDYGDDDTVVAGYKVGRTQVYCAYGIGEEGTILRDEEDSIFYAASYAFDVLDFEATYYDLQAKLNSLYGECEETTYEGEGYYASATYSGRFNSFEMLSVWRGDNDTEVKLYCYVDDIEEIRYDECVALFYGKTDFDPHLDALQTAMYNEELAAEIASRSSNTDGL